MNRYMVEAVDHTVLTCHLTRFYPEVELWACVECPWVDSRFVAEVAL